MRDEAAFFKGIPSPRVPKDMGELAGDILDRKAGHFDAAKFKDEYELALRKLVKRKAAGNAPALARGAEASVLAVRERDEDEGHGCSCPLIIRWSIMRNRPVHVSSARNTQWAPLTV